MLSVGAKRFLEAVLAPREEEQIYVDFEQLLEEMITKSGFILSRESS